MGARLAHAHMEETVRTVTKKELVNRIAEKAGVTKVVAKEIIQSFLDAIIDELADGNRLEFREFGVFETRERKARLAQNPRTLEKVPVPSKRIVKFKVGRLMRQKVSGGDDDDEDSHVPSSDHNRSGGGSGGSDGMPPGPRSTGTSEMGA